MFACRVFVGIATVVTVFGWGTSSCAQGLQPPPQELRILPTSQFRIELLPYDANGRYLEVKLSIDTMNRRVVFRWNAQASSDAGPVTKVTEESMSYFPTAYCVSSDPDSFFIAGKGLTQQQLQRWTFGNYSLMVATDVSGNQSTFFTPPSVTRSPLLVDSSVQNICDVAVNEWPPGGPSGQEEVWLFEWETRDVYVTDQGTVQKALRVSSSLVGQYRSITTARHSIYGAVFLFWRRPFYVMFHDTTNDPDFVAIYDQDLDGVIDGSWVIQKDTANSHVLYSSGEFL